MRCTYLMPAGQVHVLMMTFIIMIIIIINIIIIIIIIIIDIIIIIIIIGHPFSHSKRCQQSHIAQRKCCLVQEWSV